MSAGKPHLHSLLPSWRYLYIHSNTSASTRLLHKRLRCSEHPRQFAHTTAWRATLATVVDPLKLTTPLLRHAPWAPLAATVITSWLSVAAHAVRRRWVKLTSQLIQRRTGDRVFDAEGRLALGAHSRVRSFEWALTPPQALLACQEDPFDADDQTSAFEQMRHHIVEAFRSFQRHWCVPQNWSKSCRRI